MSKKSGFDARPQHLFLRRGNNNPRRSRPLEKKRSVASRMNGYIVDRRFLIRRTSKPTIDHWKARCYRVLFKAS